MPLDFPALPLDGETYVASNDVTYVWQADPGVWRIYVAVV